MLPATETSVAGSWCASAVLLKDELVQQLASGTRI